MVIYLFSLFSLFCCLPVFAGTTTIETTIEVPLGLPPIPWPENNPYSKEKAELGRLLYFDKRLSTNNTVSCATCHTVSGAFTDNLTVSIGIDGHQGTRNAPTVINAGYLKLLFWDGRAKSLEEQAEGPMQNPKEMTLYKDPHEAHQQCLLRIKGIKGYQELFKQVFNKDHIDLEDVVAAIATFERTVLSGNSPFDKYVAGDKSAMTKEQIHGMRVFKETGCVNCHPAPLFTDERFANIGVGMEKKNPDLGRYEITKNKNDWGAFKVPMLREVEYTYPYMHDGCFSTLEEVVDYYNDGGFKNPNLHPLMKPLHLSKEDKQALVAFLKALSGDGWQEVVSPTTFPE